VAEHPADADRTLVAETVRVKTLLAELAATARLDARQDDVVADGERRDRPAQLGDPPDSLVAEHSPRRDRRNVALDDVQISAADGRGVDAHDHVGGVLDPRRRHLLPGDRSRALIDRRFHDVCTVLSGADSRGHSSRPRKRLVVATGERKRRACGDQRFRLMISL
jgi:hypothetical protein